jgi:hydrogenase maturation protease
VIVGVGNILCGDDGLGVHAVQRLHTEYVLPRGVRVLDGGTLGPGLLAHLDPKEALVVIDALRGGGPPGALHRLDLDSLGLEAEVPLSLHDHGLRELLREAKLLDWSLRGVLLGIEPQRMDPGEPRLSPAVEETLPHLLARALEEASRLQRGASR